MRRSRAWRVSVALALALCLVAACDPGDSSPVGLGGTSESVENPFEACPAPVTPSAAAVAPASGSQLVADITLPCLAGGAPVALRALGQPAVINLWASSCYPCQKELPQFQQLADSTDGRLLVLGVVTEDTKGAAGSRATGLAVTFPALFDPSGQLRKAIPAQFLPVTLFVDAGGAVRHVDRSGALTLGELVDLVHQHLGLAVV